jgi:hypothetical protein
VATFVTVSTVPNTSVGLAHIPGGAAAYHVAWPCSPFVATDAGATWVVVGATAGAAVARAEACSTGGGAGVVVVVVVGGGVAGAVTVVGVVVGVDS